MLYTMLHERNLWLSDTEEVEKARDKAACPTRACFEELSSNQIT